MRQIDDMLSREGSAEDENPDNNQREISEEEISSGGETLLDVVEASNIMVENGTWCFGEEEQ